MEVITQLKIPAVMGKVSAVRRSTLQRKGTGFLRRGVSNGDRALGFAAVMWKGHCSDGKPSQAWGAGW